MAVAHIYIDFNQYQALHLDFMCLTYPFQIQCSSLMSDMFPLYSNIHAWDVPHAGGVSDSKFYFFFIGIHVLLTGHELKVSAYGPKSHQISLNPLKILYLFEYFVVTMNHSAPLFVPRIPYQANHETVKYTEEWLF